MARKPKADTPEKKTERRPLARRYDLILSVESERDAVINEHFDALRAGGASIAEFIRQAVYAAITGKPWQPPAVQLKLPDPDAEEPLEEGKPLTGELIREILRQELRALSAAQKAVQRPPEPLESAEADASAPLDQSPRRKRPGRPPLRTDAAVTPPVLDPEASARMLIASIRSFGRHSTQDD